jgi:hypothetical protein
MTPQELAAIQAGIDPRAYYIDQMAAARAGLLDPEAIQRGATTIAPGTTIPSSRLDKAQTFAQNALTKARQNIGAVPAALSALPVGRIGLLGGMISPALTAVEEAQADRPTGALGALLGGGAGVAGGALAGKALLGGLASAPGIPGLIGKVGQAALPIVGGMIGAPTGASVAEKTKRSMTGDPIAGATDLKNTLAERGLISDQDLDIFSRSQGIQTSNIKDLTQFYSNQQYLDMQRMNPLIQKMNNAALVRQQALMATQGQQYAMLGTLATAGKLATGSQAEMGATLRTALSTNPYASANLQSPSIAFG